VNRVTSSSSPHKNYNFSTGHFKKSIRPPTWAQFTHDTSPPPHITKKIKVKAFNNIFVYCTLSVEPTSANFNDYLIENPNMILLEFGNISQAEFITIIENLEPKNSNYIDGISNKMLKFLRFELTMPLVHLFNLSLKG
jgi:hypothetical protein